MPIALQVYMGKKACDVSSASLNWRIFTAFYSIRRPSWYSINLSPHPQTPNRSALRGFEASKRTDGFWVSSIPWLAVESSKRLCARSAIRLVVAQRVAQLSIVLFSPSPPDLLNRDASYCDWTAGKPPPLKKKPDFQGSS